MVGALGLKVARGARGRKAAPMALALTRELELGDLVELELPQEAKPAQIQRLRDSHHRLARVLASGAKPVEASAITGFSQSRISILQRDPSFRALLDHYRSVKESAFVDVVQRLESLTVDAVETLHERLHDEPDAFSVGSLVEIVKVIGDRAGFSPVQKVQAQVATMKITPEELEDLKNAERPVGVVRTVERAIAPRAEGPEDRPQEHSGATPSGTLLPARVCPDPSEDQGH